MFFKTYDINPSLIFNDELWKKHEQRNSLYYQDSTFGTNELAFFVDIDHTIQVAMVSIENSRDYVQNHEKEEYIEQLGFMTFSNSDNDFRSIRGFQVKGDDMEPNFYNGDWVFGIRKRNLNRFSFGRIYILVLEHEIVVRRVMAFDEDINTITVSMDNHAYLDYEIPIDKIFEVWKLENALQTRFPMPKSN